MNVSHKEKYYIPPQVRESFRILQHKYKVGLCHICMSFALYKVLYKLPDINVVEYYCSEHVDKFTT
jgi:hypothetical protein